MKKVWKVLSRILIGIVILALIVGACAAFMRGLMREGRNYLQRAERKLQPSRRIEVALFHTYRALDSWLSGQNKIALEHAHISDEIMQTAGAPAVHIRIKIALAQIYFSSS